MIENAISVEHKITPANRQQFLAGAEGPRRRAEIYGMPPILSGVTNAAGFRPPPTRRSSPTPTAGHASRSA